jgi:NAD(P)-dependent dehydrogenase (short-subunit alcohol dehydrogenase family)
MASRSLQKANAAMKEIQAAGIGPKGSLSAIQMDVTDENSIQEAVIDVRQQFGRLDVLVNNAGTSAIGTDVKTGYKLCLETNVMGPALATAAFRPLLLKSENPYSLYISNDERTLLRNASQRVATHVTNTNGNAYQLSKAGLNMLAVLEARDFGAQGLKVFVVSPGFVISNLRGASEEARSGKGKAADPKSSGQLILSIVRGERNADVGCLVHKDGVFPGEGRCLVKGAESNRRGHKKAGEHELTMGQLLQTDHILSYGLLFISAL